MAQLGNWFSRVFANSSTRGLSGDIGFLAEEAGASFYCSRLHLHKAKDLIEDPSLLWDIGGKEGLFSHLKAADDAVSGFTDVLIILNLPDYRRSYEESGDYWFIEAIEDLQDKVEKFCSKNNMARAFQDRPFRVHILPDNSKRLRKHLKLEAGQFVTALLPNFSEPLSESRPAIKIHLNLPGIWEDYREIGTLYSDQILFNIGSHWLDNFQHEAFEVPALYQLQQFQDGSLVHVINPDFQDAYELGTAKSQDGPSVLTISKDGNHIAYLVLAVEDESRKIEQPLEYSPGEMPVFVEEDTSEIPLPHGSVNPAVARPTPVIRVRDLQSMSGTGSFQARDLNATIIPNGMKERVFTLKERGALLQKVHFSEFMEGYDVYVSRSGQLGTSIADPAAVFQVREDKVYFVAHTDGVRMAGKVLTPGRSVRLSGELELGIGSVILEYRDLTNVFADSWPYLAEIRRSASSTYLVFGDTYKVGRDRRCKIRLPDEPHNDNIIWKPSVSGSEIRSRNGLIPKSRFYNDSIMVASEHVSLGLEDVDPKITNISRHCWAYVRQERDLVPLAPTNENGLREINLSSGDELLIGNNLFEVAFSPDLAPQQDLTPEILSAEVEPVLDELVEKKATKIKFEPTILAPEPASTPILPETLPEFDKPESTKQVRQSSVFDAPSIDTSFEPMLSSSVVTVDERELKEELTAPIMLRQIGWLVSGNVVIGNHLGANLIIPENKIKPTQQFQTKDYLSVWVRGKRAQIDVLDPKEVRLFINGQPVANAGSLEGLEIEIVRRDDEGLEDFTVTLRPKSEAWLPDPRATLLEIDNSDRMAVALFTLGVRGTRTLHLSGGRCEANLSGDSLVLQSKRSLLKRQVGGTFRRIEPGASISLTNGDMLISGDALYLLETL